MTSCFAGEEGIPSPETLAPSAPALGVQVSGEVFLDNPQPVSASQKQLDAVPLTQRHTYTELRPFHLCQGKTKGETEAGKW